jgi:hypothetical protein
MKLVTSFVMVLFLFVGSICFAQAQEHLLLSALTTSKKLLVFHVVYANKKYTIVDRATFNLPVQGGTTAIAPLPDNRFQILWTTGPATTAQGLHANSTSAPIKIKYLVVDSDLNQIGTIKTLPPTLTSHANFNYIPAPIASSFPTKAGLSSSTLSKFSFSAGKKVVLKDRNESTGTVVGPNHTVFEFVGTDIQVDTDFFQTDFFRNKYAGIRFQNARYHFLCGDVNNQAPTVMAAFPVEINNSTVLPIPNSDDFNFIVLKRLHNPERVGIDNFQIDGETCTPKRNTIVHPPVNQNVGQLLFFGGIASAPSEISPNGGHMAFVRSETGGGTDIFMNHFNTVKGNDDSPLSNLKTKPTADAGDWFVFGIRVWAMSTSN